MPAPDGAEGNEIAKELLTVNNIEIRALVSKMEIKQSIRISANKVLQGSSDREKRGRHLYHIQQQVRLLER